MNTDNKNPFYSWQRPPWWFTLILILLSAGLFAWPWLLGSSKPQADTGSMAKLLLAAYPVYVLGSAYLAYRCYDCRRELAWILVGLVVLTYAALPFLA